MMNEKQHDGRKKSGSGSVADASPVVAVGSEIGRLRIAELPPSQCPVCGADVWIVILGGVVDHGWCGSLFCTWEWPND